MFTRGPHTLHKVEWALDLIETHNLCGALFGQVSNEAKKG